MKTLSKVGLVSICLFLVAYFFVDFSRIVESAEGENSEIVYTGDIDYDLTIARDQIVFFEGETNIVNGKTLTIQEGVQIIFRGGYANLNVMDGKIVANGTAGKKITFKKENATYGIFFNSKEHQSFFRHVEIVGGGSGPFYMSRNSIRDFFIKTANAYFYSGAAGYAAIIIEGGKLKMENCEFIDSPFQDLKIWPISYYIDPNEEDEEMGITEVYLAEVEITNTNFSADRALEAEQCDFYFDRMNMLMNSDRTFCREVVYLRNNYYGDADGPNIDANGEEEDIEKGFYLKGEFTLAGYSAEKFIFESPVSGASNVLFLPGIKASHLYKYDSDTDYDLDELWVPNWFGNDVEELELDSDGKSIKKVFTKENAILKETIMGDLYESFLADLDKLKVDNVIDNYKSFAYDWRQSVEDIAKNGTPYQLETDKIQLKLIQDEINALAQSSKNGKVTIVAHSNGGLVAKAVMVENPELAAKVDKIILVASPQMGTPRATLSLLYGQEESIPTLLSQKKARALVENMPGAYGLLPSDEYLTRQRDAGDALINFSSENSERGLLYKNSYGDKIDSLDEFRDFLLAKEDNRKKPEKNEVDLENVLNEDILDEAIATHSKIDNWTPPAGVKVIQLGGWGLPTVNGINYVDKNEVKCMHNLGSTIPNCYETDKYTLIPEPKWTVDGDAIVTTPSALTMTENENVEKYWFDLYSYDTPINIGREHKDILEASDVRDFIKNEIQNGNLELPQYIKESRPNDYANARPRIKMSLYSPLDIHLYDSNGNHTGYKEIITDEGPQRIIEENIPNSFYFQLGDIKYVGFEKGENVEVRLDGYEEGSYTLKVEEVRDVESGEEIINHVTFKNLPTSENTEVNLIIPESGLEDISNLEADYNGDDIDDYVLAPIIGEEVTLPDVTSPIIEISSPQNKTYLKNEIINISYVISDDRSALGNIKVEKLLDNKVISQNEIDLSFLKVGEHKVTVRATDEANNVGEKSVTFNTSTSLPILMKNIDYFYSLKLIKSSQEKKMIINNLSIIKAEVEFYNSIKNNIFIKSKVKKILLSILGNQIENHIDVIIKKIEKDRKNYVTMIKSVLIDDLEFIKNSIK
ncbi:MAG: hypothetical protein WAV16_02365 [Candidatus Moraniibacteriota bacterium]